MNQRTPLGVSERGTPVGELSYTEASRELDEIVAFFEQREVDVDLLVARLERATAIVDELDRRLRRTRAQVEELVPRLESATLLPQDRESGRGKGGNSARRGSDPEGDGEDVAPIDEVDNEDADEDLDDEGPEGEEELDDSTEVQGENGVPVTGRHAQPHGELGESSGEHPGLF